MKKELSGLFPHLVEQSRLFRLWQEYQHLAKRFFGQFGWVFAKEFGLFFIPVADGLIRRDASDLAVDAAEVVEDKPTMKIGFHLLHALVEVNFGRAFFN